MIFLLFSLFWEFEFNESADIVFLPYDEVEFKVSMGKAISFGSWEKNVYISAEGLDSGKTYGPFNNNSKIDVINFAKEESIIRIKNNKNEKSFISIYSFKYNYTEYPIIFEENRVSLAMFYVYIIIPLLAILFILLYFVNLKNQNN